MFGVSNWLRTLKSFLHGGIRTRKLFTGKSAILILKRLTYEASRRFSMRNNIVKPLMVLQGKNDPRVLKAESDEIVEAARKRGTPVEYMVFDDEGHGFVKKENQIKGYRAIRVLERIFE